MKTIGLVGGASWVSTADYYKLLNEKVNKRLGGDNFAKCIIYSFNFAQLVEWSHKGEWDKMLDAVTEISKNLKTSGAEGLILCANTMHLIADDLRKRIDIPIIHIAEETAKVIAGKGLKKVALLGTRFTMENDFFKKKLAEKQIETLIPSDTQRNFIHRSIFDELGKDILKQETKNEYISIINSLASNGAEGIILGCTEIPLLIKQSDTKIPLFDTLGIHVDACLKFAFGE